MALLGPNGAGKSTLVKALARKLPLHGDSTFNAKLKIGYFTQHQLETLNIDESPLWHLQKMDRSILEKEARQFLGSFNFRDERVFEPIAHFSGGEKARLALALLVWQQPNLLLLDEPSNHLDLDMREALVHALQSYDGALILITHDRHLLKSLANEFYLVADAQVEAFAGDLTDYQHWLDMSKTSPRSVKVEKVNTNKNQEAAEEKALAKLEQRLVAKQQTLNDIEQLLANNELYQDKSRYQELLNYQARAAALNVEIDNIENNILLLLEKHG